MEELKNLIGALSKPLSKRSFEDIALIYNFTKEIRFFKSIADDMTSHELRECCFSLNYEFHRNGSTVLEYGTRGKKFYVILCGKVGVLLPDSEGKFNEVNEMKDGESFGEYSLNHRKPILATIYAKEDSHFAVLDKQSYYKVLESVIKVKQNRTLDVLKRNDIFAHFTNIFLIKLSYFFSEVSVKRNQTLFREGEIIDRFYIVKEGEITISKLMNTPDSFKKQKFDLAVVSKGYLLNEEDLFCENYTVTATCMSTHASVLAIQKHEFVPRMMAYDSSRLIDKINEKKNRVSEKLDHFFKARSYSAPKIPKMKISFKNIDKKVISYKKLPALSVQKQNNSSLKFLEKYKKMCLEKNEVLNNTMFTDVLRIKTPNLLRLKKPTQRSEINEDRRSQRIYRKLKPYILIKKLDFI